MPLKMSFARLLLAEKDFFSSGHPKGAAASATLYSLIEIAKANGLNQPSMPWRSSGVFFGTSCRTDL